MHFKTVNCYAAQVTGWEPRWPTNPTLCDSLSQSGLVKTRLCFVICQRPPVTTNYYRVQHLLNKECLWHKISSIVWFLTESRTQLASFRRSNLSLVLLFLIRIQSNVYLQIYIFGPCGYERDPKIKSLFLCITSSEIKCFVRKICYSGYLWISI